LGSDSSHLVENLISHMRRRGWILPGQLSVPQAFAIVGLFLRAAQEVTLDAIRVDYPAKDGGSVIPNTTETVVRQNLQLLDQHAKKIPSPIKLISLDKAETELQVALARANGAACLPLRAIATSSLSDDEVAEHYAGRSDDEALKLAHQIRHA